MSKQQSDLGWHIVCGSMEIEEFLQAGKIKLYVPKNSRHRLFLTIKYPGQELYRGHWGSELLHYDLVPDVYLGQCGRIYCTYNRYTEIAAWFLDNMFQHR